MSQTVSHLTLPELRQRIRDNRYSGSTSGLAKSYLQANLVILPQEWANDFLLFCQRNPVACPLIGMTEPGETNLEEIKCSSKSRQEYQQLSNATFYIKAVYPLLVRPLKRPGCMEKKMMI